LKEKDKALVDFVLIIDSKNDTCDREEDFCRHLKKEEQKKNYRIRLPNFKNFWLNDDPRGLFSSSKKRLVYRKMKLLVTTRISAPKIRQGFQYKNSHLSILESSIPASDTSFTSSTTSTLQARRRMVPELLRCQKNFFF